ncbi:MAG: tRNA (guanine(46)-N(7))-methyltransferase TrmB [Verrucomicrobiota bacterium]
MINEEERSRSRVKGVETDGLIRLLNNSYSVFDPRHEGDFEAIELDMGCGSGSFSLALAERFPKRLILASDIMLGRLRNLEKRVKAAGLENIAILRAASQELLAYQLPDSCLRRLHILCPDPWPKKRHRGRRLMTSDCMVKIARVLEPGGILHISTDDPQYLDLMKTNADTFPFIVEDSEKEGILDVSDITSDFEKQWREEGRVVPHIDYKVDKPSYPDYSGYRTESAIIP